MTKKRRPLIALKIIIGVVVLLGGIVFIFFYQGSTRSILKVADKFQPDESWIMITERVEPPQIICLNSVPCPSLHRAWETVDPLAREDLQHFAASSGETLSIEGNCTPLPNVSGGATTCTAKGIINNMRVEINVISSLYDKKDNKVVLSIRAL